MKNSMGLVLMIVMSSASAWAFECPKYTLSCQLEKVNEKGGNYIAAEAKGEFIGINQDEPSLPANECQATVTFSKEQTGIGLTLNALVKDNMRAYQYATKDLGALDPQSEVEAVPGKTFALYIQKTSMICSLK
jgi:hypothetical protein